jgi:hypothetical protein
MLLGGRRRGKERGGQRSSLRGTLLNVRLFAEITKRECMYNEIVKEIAADLLIGN